MIVRWQFFCKSCDAPIGIQFQKRPNTASAVALQCATCGETYDYELDDLREE